MHSLFRPGLCAAAFVALNSGAAPSAAPAIVPAAPPAAQAPAVVATSTTPPAATATSRRPDPTDASAAVPTTHHRTALTGYRRMADDPPLAWREANDNVARIGGWRAYLREARTPEPKASEAGR